MNCNKNMNFQEEEKEKPVKLFELGDGDIASNTNPKPTKFNTRLFRTRKYQRATIKNNRTKSDVSKIPFCFTGCIPEMNNVAAGPQHKSPFTIFRMSTRNNETINDNPKTPFYFTGCPLEINGVAAIPQDKTTLTESEEISASEMESKTSLSPYRNNKDYKNIEFKCEPLLENTFFFSNSKSLETHIIQGHISTSKKCTFELTNICHQEVKVATVQNGPLPLDFPSFQSFEKEKNVVSNVLIHTVSKINEVVDTMKITNGCANKFKSSSLTSEKLTLEKSVPINDPVYELIRQQRLSWWSDDDGLLNFKSQFKPNCCYEIRRDYYKAYSEVKNIYTNYKRKSQRKLKLEQWQSDEIPFDDESPKFDLKERIVLKPKDKKSISWRSEFSDESDLDDSGSSLDGSFHRPESDSTDSSDCESSTFSRSSHRNSSVPPTSSRIF